ncbi:hypothetical protein L6164_029206 [Bauhinia variegata]|uniref:Uncharacterized protein n=1 Tax=Bauhinia variegata TaxID=167791 RepID=A0ACB9L9B1_BAUVA|nr:hypothetical protein L6164_029206 [Bauhinia variegata]
MDSHQKNQFEDGFDQIEVKKGSVQEGEKLKRSPADDETVENPASTIRICDFCGKTFNSGKALGGHRRNHLQALRKEATAAAQSQKVKIHLPKPKNHENLSYLNVTDEDNNFVKMKALMSKEGKIICDLCNKEFPSMKSYCGHMRAHSERNRTGVLLPDDDSEELKDVHCVTSRTVIAPHESPIDLTKSLPSWSKTDLRGRKSIGGVEAAQNLVYLSRGEYISTPESPVLGLSPTMVPRAVFTRDAVEAKSSISRVAMQCKEKKVDDSPSREQKDKRKKEFHRRGSLDGENDEEEEESANWGEEEFEKDVNDNDSHLDESKMMKKEKKRKKILKFKSLQSSESEEDPLIKTLKARDHGYKCNICGKSFATFQALGGHTSSHNKGKNIVRTMDESGDKNGAGFGGLVIEEADTAQGLGDHHRGSSYSRRSST